MINLQLDHPTLEARVREGLTKFCKRNNIPMPKNGCDISLAYQMVKSLTPWGMYYTNAIELTDDMSCVLHNSNDEMCTAEWHVYLYTPVVIDNHEAMASIRIAKFGWTLSGYQHEPSEYSQYCFNAVMNGNENTPEWDDMYYDREKFYVEFERQNIEKINAGR